uniref:Uncharacterized protein n=1 Tax=Anopheles culicifacies TaxID=139723 RepID=A0A182LYU3_9DIPT
MPYKTGSRGIPHTTWRSINVVRTQSCTETRRNCPEPGRNTANTGIPLTIQSARPSSRSSQRSSGSIGSYGNRRPSSAPLHGSKGVLVSTSRTGAARSAAILLVSCHISAIRNSKSTSTDSQHPSSYLSDDNMTKYLERQLEHQKQLLYLDIPSLRTHNKLFSKFCKATALIGSGNHTMPGAHDGTGGGQAAGSSSTAGGSNGQYHAPYHYGTSTNDDSSFDDEDGHGTADPFVNHCYSYDLHDSIELGALPTPASEVANVAVKHIHTPLQALSLSLSISVLPILPRWYSVER